MCLAYSRLNINFEYINNFVYYMIKFANSYYFILHDYYNVMLNQNCNLYHFFILLILTCMFNKVSVGYNFSYVVMHDYIRILRKPIQLIFAEENIIFFA